MTARTAPARGRMIEERGFSFVVAEGDWLDCWDVHRSVILARGAPEDPQAVLDAYRRRPTWMWANAETGHFCRWLRARNEALPAGERAGFYGLDVYRIRSQCSGLQVGGEVDFSA
ncbi:erythromycin esterase family protein [Streptosporangium sp. NPDC048047]|uniref:erythromycin esterase family protein n=1 Tax=Streptosporangium sp. NPDC048047 TaxID=3155748 RepID=UPI003418AE5D